jgi:SAM-dependent methyltransferase
VETPETVSPTAIRRSTAIAPVATRGTEISPQEEILWALEEKAPRYNEWLLSRALPHAGGHVLEIGAGIGTFSLLMASRGIRVSALEPEEELADILEARTCDLGGIDVLRGNVEDFALDRLAEPVDSVICFNVLEHIPDDRAALKSMAACLKEGGQLMLLAPAHRLLFGETDRTVDHQRRYDLAGVSRLFSDVGLEAVQLQYVNPVGAAGWFVSSRLLRRRTLSKSSLKLYEQFVPTLRALDRLRLPLGLSVWARARHSGSPR